MKLSATSLSTYLYCARKLFLEKVLGLVEIPREALIKGSIRHIVYDGINKKEKDIVNAIKQKLSLIEIEQKYKKNYSMILRETIISKKYNLQELDLDPLAIFKKTWPYFLHEAKIRSINIFDFINKYNLYGEDLWNKLTPKIESELRIDSKNLSLNGIIDQIEVWPDHFVPIELKTGKAPITGVWPGHRIQLSCYALLIEDRFNTKVDYGYVRYLDTFETRRIEMNSFMREEVIVLIRKINELLTSNKLPDFCKNDNKCNACSLKPLCYDEKVMDSKMKKIFSKEQTKSLNIT